MPTPTLPPFLDTPAAAAPDSSGLYQKLVELPDQLAVAAQEVAKLESPARWRDVVFVVMCGMGGSAIGGEVAADLPVGFRRKPLLVNREYDLPAHVGVGTLVIIISYSGETEEALACFAEAGRLGAERFVVAGGGRLAELAQAQGVPCYRFSYQAPSRDAFGYLFAPVVWALGAAGVLEPAETDLTASIAALRAYALALAPSVPSTENPAKTLAYLMFGRVPIIVGSRLTQGVARRWKNQLNEHAKTVASWDALPELNHNTSEGFVNPAHFKADCVVLLLGTSADHPEVAKRRGIFSRHLQRSGVVVQEVVGAGVGLWAEKLTLLALGDWASYYLALLYRTDPAPVLVIDALKAELRRSV